MELALVKIKVVAWFLIRDLGMTPTSSRFVYIHRSIYVDILGFGFTSTKYLQTIHIFFFFCTARWSETVNKNAQTKSLFHLSMNPLELLMMILYIHTSPMFMKK